MRPNILLITLDQFRGDSMSAAGHPIVRTPNLDRLSDAGVRLARHYSQGSPCSPGRAALYTGMYQMNHRVVANGSPLDDSFDNIARAARRAGYRPALFGYTDQSIDPRVTDGPDDPRLKSYEGALPGFDQVLHIVNDYKPWMDFLAARGHDVSQGRDAMLATEHERPVDESISTFMTNGLLDWIDTQDQGWFAHASYIRPHPPYSAAGEYSTMYDPADVGEPIERATEIHSFHEVMLTLDACMAPTDPAAMAHMRAQYFGMISEVDAQLGRVWDALVRSGQWENTIIVVTADHAEMLGDHGLREKLGYWETSQHIVGIVRDPAHTSTHGTVIHEFTENVDIMPTLCEMMGIDVPMQCDGLSLNPFLRGEEPLIWRDAAHWEYDWRYVFIPTYPHEWPWRRSLERMNLAVRRSDTHAYVQFGDGDWLCFDLAADPTWRATTDDPSTVAREAQAMLRWRLQHAGRSMTNFLVLDGGQGRWPARVPWREAP